MSVTAASLTASFSANNTTPYAGQTVGFSDSSTGSPSGWSWFFGDEDYKNPWILQNGSSGWSPRSFFPAVVTPNGSIIITGGWNKIPGGPAGADVNETWISLDYGVHWTMVNSSSGWEARDGHGMVVLPDYTIVLTGGSSSIVYNDTWKSIDNGTTWTLVNTSSGWIARQNHGMVVANDSSIILFGGDSSGYVLNDTWRSTDKGSTWTLVNVSGLPESESYCGAELANDSSITFYGGYYYSIPGYGYKMFKSYDYGSTWVVSGENLTVNRSSCRFHQMPDNSFIAFGGDTENNYVENASANDSMRTVDNGNSWVSLNTSNAWSGRFYFGSVKMPDGSIVLMGGSTSWYSYNGTNDTWRFMPAGSINQNPSHIYSSPGIYNLTLRVFNSSTFNTSKVLNYMNVTLNSLNASFSVNNTTPWTGQPVGFTDLTDRGTPTNWSWYFGDNYTTPWTLQNATPAWSARSYFSAARTPNNSIILAGGYQKILGSAGSNVNDTWLSIDYGKTWYLKNGSSGWSARYSHSIVVLPDYTIILAGGHDDTKRYNDTWKSIDNGTTWTLVNASGGWTPRTDFGMVVANDSSIILFGGYPDSGIRTNDTWRSTDKGSTWTRMSYTPNWEGRSEFGGYDVLENGTIVFLGGFSCGGCNWGNDTWATTDYGATWVRMGWSLDQYRADAKFFQMPDESFVTFGGYSNKTYDISNDSWRSIDGGNSWVLINESNAWDSRIYFASVKMFDGSIILMGGANDSTWTNSTNSTWRFAPAGSTNQNPTHIYSQNGTYNVALRIFNSTVFNTSLVSNLITATTHSMIASFFANDTTPNPGDPVQFTQDSVGDFVGQSWFLGDSESYSKAWTLQSSNPGWVGRGYHDAVALPDGSLVLAGGWQNYIGECLNDTWRSIDGGVTWTLQNASSGWGARYSPSMTVASDGSIILTGGTVCGSPDQVKNDTWRSTDKGVTWTLMNGSSSWTPRYYHESVSLSDGSILIAGGVRTTGNAKLNDTWRSTDNGAHWTLMNESSGWLNRSQFGFIATSNNTLFVIGGFMPSGISRGDVWASIDKGATWTQLSTEAEWSGGNGLGGLEVEVMPDDSLIIIGGYGGAYFGVNYSQNDTWRSTNYINWSRINYSNTWQPVVEYATAVLSNGSVVLAGGSNWVDWDTGTNNTYMFTPWSSTEYNPVHNYVEPGNHSVGLRVYNLTSFNTSLRSQYIQVPDYVYSMGTLFTAYPMSGTAPLSVAFTDQTTGSPTFWNWSFGDGNYSTERNPTHIFVSGGVYTVILNASNPYAWANYSRNISVGGAYPIANFTASPVFGQPPLTVYFTSDSHTTGTTTYYWNFDDGSNSTSQNPSHIFSSSGTYHVTLTVTDTIGIDTSDATTIYVTSSLLPLVNFIGTPLSASSAPLSVTFTDLTQNINPATSTWNWSFGDGSYSTLQNPTHLYTASGQYPVTLVVTNVSVSPSVSNYTTKLGYINIAVTPGVVYVNFTASPLSGSSPLTVHFYDSSICNPYCNNWAWDFNGDGSTDSTLQNPTYTYTYPGIYSPQLIASNGVDSGVRIRIHYITAGTIYVKTTIPQPTSSWTPGYNGTIFKLEGGTSVDMANSTYLKYWLQNFTATGNFSVYGFALGLLAPIMHVFGFWIFLIIWGLYLFAVWIRSQDVTLPLVIGILTMGTFGLLFPKESLPIIIIMFVVCGAIIIYKLTRD